MSDTPKFEVIDRRKFKAEEEERQGIGTCTRVQARAGLNGTARRSTVGSARKQA